MSNIMELADAYAVAASMTLVEPGLKRLRDNEATRAALEAAVAELEKDAARYRWLREQVYIDTDKRLRIARTYLIQSGTDTTAEMLDAAIDAARRGMITPERLTELKKAGYEGRMQWLAYWEPQYPNEAPTESDWHHVYQHETDGMIREYGADRFRIKPRKLPDNAELCG